MMDRDTTLPPTIDQTIGNTPLVRLNRVLDGAPALVLAKIEGRNPAYSVKCRLGAALVWDAEERGVLLLQQLDLPCWLLAHWLRP